MTHTEAPASVNFRAYTKTGWQLQITLRDDSESNLLELMGNTITAITERGMTPNSNNGSSTTSSNDASNAKSKSCKRCCTDGQGTKSWTSRIKN